MDICHTANNQNILYLAIQPQSSEEAQILTTNVCFVPGGCSLVQKLVMGSVEQAPSTEEQVRSTEDQVMSPEEQQECDRMAAAIISNDPHDVLVEFSSVVADTQEYLIGVSLLYFNLAVDI